jgi:hypothetical protein
MRKQIFFLLVILISFTMYAEKPRLAVMAIDDQSEKLSERIKDSATILLRMHLSSSGQFIVIEEGRQKKMLMKIVREQRKESYKMCYDDKCQIPLGQALSADTILRSTVTELGGTFSIGVELIDLAKEAVTKAANAEFDGTEEGMAEAVKKIAHDLTVRSIEEANKRKEEEEKRKEQAKIEAQKKQQMELEIKRKKEKEEELLRKRKEEQKMLAYQEELHTAGSTRRTVALTSFLSGIAFSGAGIGLIMYSKQLDEKWKDSYELYLDAKTEEDAVKHRKDVEKYRDRETATKVLGGIFTGVGAGLVITGIIAWSVDSKAEKGVKKKYDISFTMDPFSKTAFLSINY